MFAEDTHYANDNRDDEEYGEDDVVGEGSGVYEKVSLWHAEETQDDAYEEYGQLPNSLNQEKVDEKLQYFIICLEPFHAVMCYLHAVFGAQM